MTILRRDFGALILDLDGKPVRLGLSIESINAVLAKFSAGLPDDQALRLKAMLDEEAGKPLTLGRAAADALINTLPGDERIDGSEKVSRVGLAVMVNTVGIVEINPEQRDSIKACLNKRFSMPLIVARAWEFLEKEAQAD